MVYKYPKKRKQFSGQIYVFVKEYKNKEGALKRVKALRKGGHRARYLKNHLGYFSVYKRDLTVEKIRAKRRTV